MSVGIYPSDVVFCPFFPSSTLADSPMTPNTTTAVAAASSNVRTFGTKSGTLPKSAAEIAQDVLRSKGVKGLYKGLGATLAR